MMNASSRFLRTSHRQQIVLKRGSFLIKSASASSKVSHAGSSNGKQNAVSGVLGGAALGTECAGGYFYKELGGLDGINRSLSFYSIAIPRYLEYRWLQWRDNGDNDSLDKEWDELHRRASQQVRST